MSTYRQNFWAAQDLAAVCALQNTSSAGNLVLNGTYYVAPTPTISFLKQGFARKVSITASGTDLSSITFTISGVQNSTLVTSVITGPAASSTVYTPDYFDIISCSCDWFISCLYILFSIFPVLCSKLKIFLDL